MKNKFQFGGIYNPEGTSVAENNGAACINDREYPFIKDCSEVILTRQEINEINNIINKEPTEFVNLILKRNPNCNTICGLNLLYEYYIKRPEIIYDKNDLTDMQKCINIKNNPERFLELMNEVILPEYFFDV